MLSTVQPAAVVAREFSHNVVGSRQKSPAREEGVLPFQAGALGTVGSKE